MDEYFRMVDRLGDLAMQISALESCLLLAAAFGAAGAVPDQQTVEEWRAVARNARQTLDSRKVEK
jgi:hypothetical protein